MKESKLIYARRGYKTSHHFSKKNDDLFGIISKKKRENKMQEKIVTLRKGEGRLLKAGGMWVFDNEIEKVNGNPEWGQLVHVQDFDGYPMGIGFYNENSKIRVRMLSRNADAVIDESFLYERVKNAWEYRKQVMNSVKRETENPNVLNGLGGDSDTGCCRVIFGEADFLPGLVVDKFSDVLVVESLAFGIDCLKETILQKLIDVLHEDGIEIRMIFERSDAPVRKKEGMQPFKGILWTRGKGFWTKEDRADFRQKHQGDDLSGLDENPQVEIVENGVHYLVDVENGQKTGFFLDQKYNRLAMQRICKGANRVLDCFTHMGTFALNAGLAGAKDVTGLDISDFAIMQATRNAKLNQLSDYVHFRQANVLDELPKLAAAGEQFDVVILDPPAFTKSKEATKNAIKGYREINIKGLKLVKDGGYFATCSCSHFMTQELFTTVIGQAAKSAHKRLRQIEFRTQAPDHPILWAADESYYLKFYIFQVVDEK